MADKENAPSMLELVAELVAGVPEELGRESARAELLAALAGIYRTRAVAPPAWVANAAGEPEGYPEHLQFIDAVAATETVRFAIRRAAKANPRGIVGVAADIGVPVAVLNGIVLSVDMVPRQWWTRLAALSYALGSLAPHPGVVGLGLAVADLPAEHRTAAREVLTSALANYLRGHALAPEWLEVEAAHPARPGASLDRDSARIQGQA